MMSKEEIREWRLLCIEVIEAPDISDEHKINCRKIKSVLDAVLQDNETVMI